MRPRRTIATAVFLFAVTSATRVDAQQFRRGSVSRLQVSAWAGGLVNRNGGFSSDSTDFVRFDRAPAFGGAVHVAIGGGLSVGLDGLYSRPGYSRFIRSQATEPTTGDARMVATILSARLQGSPGGFGIYFSGGAGFVFWDVPELPESYRDNALTAGFGVEFPALPAASIFAEYDQWWVYHAKVGNVVKNRVSRTLLKLGLRLSLF
jgi:hypothetical protein